MSAGIIVILVIAIVLLIVQTVLSTLAAIEITKARDATTAVDRTAFLGRAHLYSTAAAVTAGLAIVGLIIMMILYINSQRILTAAHKKLGQAVATYGAHGEVAKAATEAAEEAK